jgi:3-dehydrotetronate 4-kinase
MRLMREESISRRRRFVRAPTLRLPYQRAVHATTAMHLGCIADDFTGATDLASNLVRSGMRVVQVNGVPSAADDPPPATGCDAIVVALKSRTTAPADAVAQSLAALRWLQAQGASRFYQKVCSTFDSTPRGNIGPVADALMRELRAPFAMACPAFPQNQRTVFKGHLFVGDLLLSDSGMRHHPLTPMTDANLVRVLQPQTTHRVGLIEHRDVRRGADAIRTRVLQLRDDGFGIAIVDAVDDADLMAIGLAAKDDALVVAGSGVAIGLPQNVGIAPSDRASWLPPPRGRRAIVSGSCSVASNAQVAHFIGSGGQAFAVDPLRLAAGQDVAARALEWAATRPARASVLIYATAQADAVRQVQQQLGVEQAGAMVEATLAAIAQGLVRDGVRQLVVAGGETSGACVQALGIRQMRIGAPIDPGVPWCHAQSALDGGDGLHIALKSGNFGTPDFFTKAFDRLQ